MRGLILYFSCIGNTKLACQYINKKTKNIQFDLVSMVDSPKPNLQDYDLIGLACFTMFWLPPYFARDYFNELEVPKDKPAFVFNTYGMTTGRTLPVLAQWANLKGFKVVAGYSLHTPESFPPLIANKITQKQAPNSKELIKFNKFITELDGVAEKIAQGKSVPTRSIKLNPLNPFGWVPLRTRENVRRQMGEKFIDKNLCVKCGLCARSCPKKAIALNPYPVFNMQKCDGCWRCFNRCPQKAIYTKKLKGVGHYPRPAEEFGKKLQ